MMGIRGFKTKKALRERVKASVDAMQQLGIPTSRDVEVIDGSTLTFGAMMNRASIQALKPLRAASVIIETSMFGPELKDNGRFCVVGPDPYKRKWFAEIEVKDGIIVKVK
jgi:hypothetical protein